MEERTYKVMGGSGALNIAVGVVALVVGVASGVLLLISGAKLLAGRSKINLYISVFRHLPISKLWMDREFGQ